MDLESVANYFQEVSSTFSLWQLDDVLDKVWVKH
jgi:hypothetical protein